MLPYIGGKCALSKWIISNFPENYQQMQYVEVFGGGGWVLFKKDRSYLETYNDKNENLVNLFRTIRANYEEFKFLSEWTLHSRSEYNKAREMLKDKRQLKEISDLLYYAIEKCQSFSCTISGGWSSQVTSDHFSSGRWMPFINKLPKIKERLEKVQIECLDFRKLIKKYDNANTLFYLDPPYIGLEYYYSERFSRTDHEDLANLLKQIKGKFVLSYYENPLARELYNDFNIIAKSVTKPSVVITPNSTNRSKPKGTELLIKNF